MTKTRLEKKLKELSTTTEIEDDSEEYYLRRFLYEMKQRRDFQRQLKRRH